MKDKVFSELRNQQEGSRKDSIQTQIFFNLLLSFIPSFHPPNSNEKKINYQFYSWLTVAAILFFNLDCLYLFVSGADFWLLAWAFFISCIFSQIAVNHWQKDRKGKFTLWRNTA